MFSKALSMASAAATAASSAAVAVAKEGRKQLDRVNSFEEAASLPVDDAHLPPEGDGLEFTSAFEALGVPAAAEALDRLGDLLQQLHLPPNKSKLQQGLIFVSSGGGGGGGASGELPASVRRLKVTATEAKEVSVDFGAVDAGAEAGAEAEAGPPDLVHDVQLTVNGNSAHAHLRITKFASLAGLQAFLARGLWNLDCCDATCCALFRRHFAGLIKTFYLITMPLQVLEDPQPASAEDHELGLARHVNFKCRVTLDNLGSEYPWVKRILSWMDKCSFEIIDAHEKGQPHSKRRLGVFGWDRATSAFTTEFVKAGGDVLWHDKTDVATSVRQLNSRMPREKYLPAAKVTLGVGGTFVLRVSFAFCLADLAVFSVGAFTKTTVYFSCVIKSHEEIEMTLLDITGLSGRAAKLLMPSMVEALTDSVRACISLRPAEGKAESLLSPFNELNIQVGGTVAPNSLLAKLVQLLWEKIVLSDCLWEIFQLWSYFFNALSHDVLNYRAEPKLSKPKAGSGGNEGSPRVPRKLVLTDAFASHNWSKGNHAKVSRIVQGLVRRGLAVWFDEVEMSGNVRDAMARGIEETKMCLCFITAEYRDKVNSDDKNDNCKFEFNAAVQKDANAMIAVVMEEGMRATREWGGNLGGTLGSDLYCDMSRPGLYDDDGLEAFEAGVDAIFERVMQVIGTTREQNRAAACQEASAPR